MRENNVTWKGDRVGERVADTDNRVADSLAQFWLGKAPLLRGRGNTRSAGQNVHFLLEAKIPGLFYNFCLQSRKASLNNHQNVRKPQDLVIVKLITKCHDNFSEKVQK